MTQETDPSRPSAETPSENVVDGNRLRLLPGGPERFEALMTLIATARRRIDLYVYIFARDQSATEVCEALIDACNRGVSVTLLIDAFGSAMTPDSLFTSLIEAGARFGRFGQRHSTRYLIRNHQKMVIVDGRKAMIGGFNIADSYFALADDPAGWCDFALMVEGPVTQDLARWYDGLADWTLSRQQSFRALRRMVRDWPHEEQSACWLMGGPTRLLNSWARCMKRDIQHGGRLDLVAAYFSPGWSMVRRLGRIAQAGSARIIVPSRSDNPATVGAARHLYRKLLRHRVEIREYLPQKLHAKLIVIDDICYVGSANFDMRSLFLNVELMLRIEDKAFAQTLRAQVDRLAESSRPIDKATFRAMAGPFSRLRWWIDYLLVGVLDYTVTRRLNLRRRRS